MQSLTWDEVRSRRLARSHLHERAPIERLVEVVRDVCGIHAQVMGSAELQLAARRRGGHAGRRPRRALGAARAREVVDAARHAAPPSGRRALALDRGASRPSIGEADYVAEDVGRSTSRGRGDRRRARGKRLTREELADAVVRARRCGAARAARVGLGLLPRRRCARRPCSASAACGPEGDVRATRTTGSVRSRIVGAPRGAARGGAPLRRGIRPRHSPRVSRVVHLSELHSSAAARDLFEELDVPEPGRLEPRAESCACCRSTTST